MDPYEIYSIIPKDGEVKHVYDTTVEHAVW